MMNGRLPFLDHASDLLLQLYPICLVLLFPHELIKRPLLIALHVPGHDHLRRACGLGHCVMAAPVPLRSFFSSATSFTRRSAPLITVGPLSSLALFFLPRKNCPIEISFIPRGEGFFGFFCRLRRWGGRHPAPTRVPLRVCGTQAPASEMGTGNSASHLRVCRTNLDG